jgi:predicted dehydrogenase
MTILHLLGCRWFHSPEEMMASGAVDVVVIATPHWQHVKLAAAALQAGLHVICEKPLTVTVSEADEVLRIANKSKGLLTAVFQSRFEPAYQRAKAMLASGELGRMARHLEGRGRGGIAQSGASRPGSLFVALRKARKCNRVMRHYASFH